MSKDKESPKAEGAEQVPAAVQPQPDWVIKDGKIIIEGADVTDVLAPKSDLVPEDETPQADADNAAVEGNEPETKEPEPTETEEVEEAEPEKPEADSDDTEEEEEEAEESGTPTKIPVKTKFRGREFEEELTPEDIQVRLNRLRAFEENQKEFWDQKKEVEPYAELVKSDWFKRTLNEAYESGELTKPTTPPEPPPQVLYEVHRRQADPDYDVVMAELRTYAMSLPFEAAQLIDSDPNVFLSEYDRFAQQVRSKPKEPTEETAEAPKKKTKKEPPEEVKKKLAYRESVKDKSKVTKPGTATEPVSEYKKWEQRERELVRAIRNPNNKNQNLELIAELIAHRDNQPTQ